jgi:squalene-hopene/tetraprenyl-beta-curcumene cyclase
MKRAIIPTFIFALVASLQPAFTQAPAAGAGAKPVTDLEKKGIEFLLKAQNNDGAWMPEVGPALTAMNVKILLQAGKPVSEPAIQKALAFIDTMKQKDGGFYKESNPNYNSSIVLSTFAMMPDARKADIAGLQTFLRTLQQDGTKKDGADALVTKEHPWYGGTSYSQGRPDLSNSSFYIEALRESGIPTTDPVIQRALVFISRSQLLGETNDLPFAKGSTDGGFIYSPAEGGMTRISDTDRPGETGIRSYGSMTYSGLKSLLYAGLTQDDPRVKAATKWIQSNWTLEYNPGTSNAEGQFYFYHAFAKALKAYKHDEITDTKGVKHNWRNELIDALKASQKPDGSWVNAKAERWMEGNPVLATTYAVLALQEARK